MLSMYLPGVMARFIINNYIMIFCMVLRHVFLVRYRQASISFYDKRDAHRVDTVTCCLGYMSESLDNVMVTLVL